MAPDAARMIEANMAARSRGFEQRMLIHASKLVQAHIERQQFTSGQAWRDASLLWPTFTQG